MVERAIVLDTGPIGLITNPKLSSYGIACNQWLQAHLNAGNRVIIPEIADYEVRRELLRANKQKGLARLDSLCRRLEYLPLTTAAMRQAAALWAQARQQGQPTAGDKTIDGDMIHRPGPNASGFLRGHCYNQCGASIQIYCGRTMAKHCGLIPTALPNCPRHSGNGGPGDGFLVLFGFLGQVFGQGARAASGGGGVA